MKVGLKTNYAALLAAAGFLFLVTGQAPAQTERTAAQLAPVNTTEPAIKKPVAPLTSVNLEIDLLKAQMAAQQEQIDQLRKLVDAQAQLIESGFRTHAAADQPDAPAAGLDPAATPASRVRSSQETRIQDQQASPLRLRIGTVDITPIGFMDFTAVIRDKNVGSGLGTNFGAIPFNNTVNGHLRETRFSAQNSRLGLRFDTTVKGAKILGYLETDFLGIVPGNVAVSANSDTNRLRLFWVDIRKNKFEFLGGQSWSLLTPNRKGLSPLPGDLFLTDVVDPNLHVGLIWTRNPQLRLIYHANETITLGVSIEASEQFAGGASGSGAITLPTNLTSSYGPQLNTGSNNFATPNAHQDIVAKFAFDPKLGTRTLHFEVAGVLTRFAFFNPLSNRNFSAAGGGGSVNLNVELAKNFRFFANTFYSDGAGRYIFGLGPDLIIRGDGSPSLVRSASTLDGIEYQATPRLIVYAYYGGAYFGRNIAIDPANGQPVGFGYTGSPSNHNRSIQQGTFGLTRTIWRDPSYGTLQWGAQYSYLVRHPWYVAPGQPGAANLNMLFLNFRYVLPGAPPSTQK